MKDAHTTFLVDDRDTSKVDANAFKRVTETTRDIVNIIQKLPQDEAFWMNVRHVKELTNEDARRFISTIHFEAGQKNGTDITMEQAEEIADQKLEDMGRNEYLERRLVADKDNLYDFHSGHYSLKLFSAVSGITVRSVRESLRELGYMDEFHYVNTRLEELEWKYNDPYDCPEPYHFAEEAQGSFDMICKWSCGEGTKPDHASYECVCQEGFLEYGTDHLNRRICAKYDCWTDEDWTDAKSEWCCEYQGKGCPEPDCSLSPYHVEVEVSGTLDILCKWSCGEGTTPDDESYECVCQEGFLEYSIDQFGRRICTQYDCWTDEYWTDAKSEWCCAHQGQGCPEPTFKPTHEPTDFPTLRPTFEPTFEPTELPTLPPTSPAPTTSPTECLASYLSNKCNDWNEIISQSSYARENGINSCDDIDVEDCAQNFWVKTMCKCTCDSIVRVELKSLRWKNLRVQINGKDHFITKKESTFVDLKLPIKLTNCANAFRVVNAKELNIDIKMGEPQWNGWFHCDNKNRKDNCDKIARGEFWWKGDYYVTQK
jgi:hypothetical protein